MSRNGRHFKPILAAVLAMTLLLGLGGCGKSESEEVFVPDDASTVQAAETTTSDNSAGSTADTGSSSSDNVAAADPSSAQTADSSNTAGIAASGYTAPDENQNVIDVVVNAGADQTQADFTWYGQISDPGSVILAKTSEMIGNTFPITATVTASSVSGADYENYMVNKATVTGLEADTRYTYMVGSSSGWSKAYSFKTAADGELNIIVTGDIQLGTGDDDVPNQEAWTRISQEAAERFPDYNMHINLGDVATLPDEYFWNYVLTSPLYNSYLVSNVRGNHDSGWVFNRHFSTPNVSEFGLRDDLQNGHYWYRQGDVLFIVLNYQIEGEDILVDDRYFIKYTLEDNPDVRWKVVLMHPSAVSSVESNQDWSNENRQFFMQVMDEFGIDMVLCGHDHVYTRSYICRADSVEKSDTSSVNNPDGTLYLIFSSASGSQYHEAVDNPYAAKVLQTYTPHISTINFTYHSMKLTVYDADSWDVLDTFEITKD